MTPTTVLPCCPAPSNSSDELRGNAGRRLQQAHGDQHPAQRPQRAVAGRLLLQAGRRGRQRGKGKLIG